MRGQSDRFSSAFHCSRLASSTSGEIGFGTPMVLQILSLREAWCQEIMGRIARSKYRVPIGEGSATRNRHGTENSAKE